MKKFFEFFKKHRKALTNVFTVVVVVLMVAYLYENRGVFSTLENVEFKYIVYIIMAQVVTVLLNAIANQRVIKILERNVSYKDAFMLQYSNNFLNKIVSEGGAVFRGYFLKEVYKLPYTKYVSTIAGLYILSFLSYSIIGIISLIYIFLEYGNINYWVMGFFLGLLVATITLLFVNPVVKNRKNKRVLKWIVSTLEGWKEIKKHRGELAIFTILIVAMLLLNAPQAIFVYRALGQHLGIFESLYMSSISIISTFINITPNGIGIKEGVYMFSSEIIGLDSDIILLGALMVRAVSLIPSFVIGGISYLGLAKRLKSNEHFKEVPNSK